MIRSFSRRGGTLPVGSQTAEIAGGNICTLLDGESFTALSLTISGSLRTSGTCSITADLILNNGSATALAQLSGDLSVTGNVSFTACSQLADRQR